MRCLAPGRLLGVFCCPVRQEYRLILFFSHNSRIQCFAKIEALKSTIKSFFLQVETRNLMVDVEAGQARACAYAGTFPSPLDLCAKCASTSSSHRQEIRRIQLSRLYGHFTPCRLCARYLSSTFLLNYPTPMDLHNFQANPATYPS